MTPSNLLAQGMNWIFFDLDDTLWDFALNSLESLHRLFSDYPEINSVFTSHDHFLDAYHLHNSELWDLHHQGKISSGFLRPERWRRTLLEAGVNAGPELCHNLDHAYLSTLCSLPAIVAGAKETLEALSKKYLIGIISNGFTDTQYKKLRVSGLDRYVTRMIISDEIGIQKPDSRIFKYAASETGTKVSPIFIGDNPETDIIGALEAGWRAIWLNPQEKKFPWSQNELSKHGIDPRLMLGIVKDLKSIIPFIQGNTFHC